ncbi:hypothetical protein JYT74_03645 [Crocinitomix catalasitica]|nr:hypothetical protein [Crocinitomix catalasitica]
MFTLQGIKRAPLFGGEVFGGEERKSHILDQSQANISVTSFSKKFELSPLSRLRWFFVHCFRPMAWIQYRQSKFKLKIDFKSSSKKFELSPLRVTLIKAFAAGKRFFLCE